MGFSNASGVARTAVWINAAVLILHKYIWKYI